MLIFLLLFAVLRTLHGAPLVSSHFPDADDLLAFVVRDDAATSCDCGQNLRTRFSIVQSCLLTIFACVWKAMHLNIDAETDSGWTRLKRRITTTLVALIAPELMLFWALQQRLAAKEIAEKYNREIAQIPDETGATFNIKTPLWPQIAAFVRAHLNAPFSSIQFFFRDRSRDNGQRWTATHGFFIQMGGFMLYRMGCPKEVLDYDRLKALIKDSSLDQPTVTERELLDRSKGDPISKAVVVWQTMWFALQCCARLAQRLPLSELEVATLAFTVVNIAIYAAWWDKPQSVDTAIRLQLNEVGVGNNSTEAMPTSNKVTETENNSHVEHQSSELSHSTDSVNSAEIQNLMDESTSVVRPFTADSDDVQPDISDTRPRIPEDKPDEKGSWLRQKLREDRQNHGLPKFLLSRLPYRIIGSGGHILNKVCNPGGFDRKRLRTPMFYAEKNSSSTPGYVLAVIGLLFGAIHFIAWSTEFPSRLDQALWRCASIALVMFPSAFFLGAIIAATEDSHFESKAVKKILDLLMNVIVLVGILPSFLLYIPARLVVIILSLKAIRNPSPAILQDVSWASFIPHL